LDFGAVDLVVDRDNKEYVLEVNTAPALSPLRLQHYAEALRKVLRGIN
jgi:D-alanine-D-alanine ligase-like ATP-grasp enzyme